MDSERLYRTLIEGTNDLVYSIRLDGSFEFTNQAWQETLGYTEDEVAGLKFEDIVFPEVLGAQRAVLSSVFDGDAMTKVESVFVTKNGDHVFAEGNLFPRLEKGQVVAAQGFFRNITEQHLAEERFRKERTRADFFLDLMIHDLTNINQEVISAFELLLNDPSLPPQLKEIVEEGLREVERASSLVANVRKISIIETSPHMMSRYDLGDTVLGAVEAVGAAFKTKNLKIKTNLERGQLFVKADEYLYDVFYALIHNAMKFDEKSDVEVGIMVEPIKHTPFLKLEIKDRGPGIADKYKEEVFARISDRREGILGLGLGLTLVKKILENYGGQIRVEDREEGDHTKGANFVILLRYEQKRRNSGGDE